MKNIRLRGMLRGALLATVLTGAACHRSEPTAQKSAPAPAVPVQTAVAEQRDVPRAIDSVGTVQALWTVDVKSQVDGIIARIHFREGDEVKAGDLLVTLDQRPFENALRIARAELENARAQATQAEADVERYRNLDQLDAISKEQFAQLQTKHATAQASVKAREAAVANAELQLSYTEVRAPISGRTGQLMLHEGALVKARDASIVTLNQLTPITIAFAVPESTLPAIRRAAAEGHARVSVIAGEDEPAAGSAGADGARPPAHADGQLTFVDNAVDPTTGTITLKAEFPNEDHALWPGQFVHTQLAIGVDRGAIVVPSPAVQVGQDRTQVYVVKPDHTVELRTVRVLRTAGDLTLLADGVRPGETVVTDGQLRLVPGAKVEAKTLAAAAAATGAKTAQLAP